ncbi:MAG TPA: TadG family pilus assembly protein [Vicinamibacterales bacterium]|nr:TadG family pilus assembly protein [Vicinamibacterales bacterium]
MQSAVNTGKANKVAGDTVALDSGDVTFLSDPSGEPNRVRVQVYRTTGRSNPVTTLMASFFGVDTVDISATATAEASPANAATCVKPFTIPDRWIEKGTPPWDPNDTFDLLDSKGKPVAKPDVYIPVNQPGYTGYNADRDRGMQMTLKSDNSTKVAPSFYNPWAMSGGTGANFYSENIAQCNTSVIPIGAPMTTEPGNMVGPTTQGVNELVARDPGAYWDNGCDCVKGSAFAKSPRVAVIPVYDPVYYEEGKHNRRGASLRIANYLGFFIEGMQGSEVKGRITPVGGVFSAGAGPAPAGAFPKVIRLVQ